MTSTMEALSASAAVIDAGQLRAADDLVAPAAVLVVAAAPGRRIPGAVVRFASSAQPAGLQFRSLADLTWRSRDGRLLVAVWESTGDRRRPVARDHHWHLDDTGLTVLTGRWRRPAMPWAPPGPSTARVAASLARYGPDATFDDALGAFAAVSVTDDGRGLVACDPLGFGALYEGSTPDITVIGSRATLVAHALAAPGRPARDPVAAACLAHLPWSMGERSGFEGVRVLPEAVRITLEPHRRPRVGGTRAPWLRRDDGGAEGPDRLAAEPEVLDRIAGIVIDELQAILDIPAERHHLDLTGGKDTRLLLALALHGGLADQFVLRTAGPPHLVDVQIASALSAELGLRHETGNVWPATTDPWAERVEVFVAETCGTVNVWDLKSRRDEPCQVRVSGTSGECLRAHRQVRPRPDDVGDVVTALTTGLGRGSLGLVDPDVRAQIDAELVARVVIDPVGGSDPLDLLATFQLHRTRSYRANMDEIESDARFWPLAAPGAVAAALQLDPGRRQDEVVHHDLMARTSPFLAGHPFSGGGWVGSVGPTAERPAARRPKAENLLAANHRSAPEERYAVVADALADATNPAWDVIDRRRTLDAFDRRSSLTPRQRRQLFGAATAALWLAGP